MTVDFSALDAVVEGIEGPMRISLSVTFTIASPGGEGNRLAIRSLAMMEALVGRVYDESFDAALSRAAAGLTSQPGRILPTAYETDPGKPVPITKEQYEALVQAASDDQPASGVCH